MKIIGICGPSGSGKSQVSRIFAALGFVVMDCDEIYHGLVSAFGPCLSEIVERFGPSVVRDGALDRNALRDVVFSDPDRLKELNQITHKHVLNELALRLEEAKKLGNEFALIDAPLFFEAGLENWCDAVIAVIASEKIQIQRIVRRDHITEAEAKLRIRNQIPSEVLQSKVEYVIQNNGNLKELEARCLEIFHCFSQKSAK